MNRVSGRIVTPQGIQSGTLGFSSSIEEVVPNGAKIDAPWILPGFIDLHVHGGGGTDCMDGADAVRNMAAFHARHGTTSLLPTTMTDEIDRITSAFEGIALAMDDPAPFISDLLGVHLEGPFINPDALGAQPPFAIPPDPKLFSQWHAMAPIKVATIAPEVDEACLLLEVCQLTGTRLQIGHSCASYAQAMTALDLGYAGFTHLFNAMTGLHHRRPGIVGCALAHADHAEMILDLGHVEAPVVRAALRAIPNLYAITDAAAAAGMPDGKYHLGRQEVIKTGDKVLMPGGETIAGSALSMDQAFRNLLSLGLNMAEASRRCSTIQADYLGLSDRGRIEVGKRADLVVLDRELNVREVYIRGHQVKMQ